MTLYDRIGRSYARHRAAEPAIEERIKAAFGDAVNVVNVGAGTGSYEPRDRICVAVEPSPVMIEQRPPNAAPVVAAFAEALPFADDTFDVAMAVLTVHHWNDPEAGLREMRRVASRVVIFGFDLVALHERFWLIRDYLPELLTLESGSPTVERAAEITGAASIESVPLPATCRDGFMPAYWARPEAYLDPSVRSAISVFHRLDPAIVRRMVMKLSEDLGSGRWDKRYGSLRDTKELELGFR
ncbi:MAG TPA: class I SAM-dependent methyltransferase, partial [Actinomycetota bacterium]|nr:class I SAM-dependent methyltransferase [Actinomycetota bacterium]